MSTSGGGRQQPVYSTKLAGPGVTGNVLLANDQGIDNTEIEFVAVGTIAAQAIAFTIQGSFDGTNWYPCGYERIDNQATVSRSVSAITLTPGAGTAREVITLLDMYPLVGINVSANTLSGVGAGLTGNVYAVPE